MRHSAVYIILYKQGEYKKKSVQLTVQPRDMNTDLASLFGQRIRICREKRGWTQTHAANIMGVQRTSLNRWEKGHEMPRGDSMTKLRDYLQVPIGTQENDDQQAGLNSYQLVFPFDRTINLEVRISPQRTEAVQVQVQFKSVAS